LRHILIILSIFLFSFTVISCSSSSDSGSSTTSTTSDNGTTTTEDTTTTTDTTAPVIAEVTFVTTPNNDTTPDYTFSSNEAGTITYGGSCSSSTTSATSGNNTITLVSLSERTYSDCTITVTDSAGNVSNTLTITSFIVDTTAATLVEVTAVTTLTNDPTPDYTFSSSEAGAITYGGSCSSSTTSATTDNNTITLVSLSDGTYSNCTIKVTDSAGNSVTLNIGSFVIDTTAPILAEVAVVTTPDNETIPNYTFSSTEAGTITYGGSCTSSTTSASAGNNAITFSTLSIGTYDNCTVLVTDNASNSSNNLPVSTFTVDNTTISSSADNATFAFGQTYQYQLSTNSTFSGTITYSLSNQPDNMTISSSGLVEWTPTKASEITTHSNITITLTTSSGYVLTQTYNLTVTGTCTPGNVLAIWSGDQRSSTDSSKFLGNITAYTDNESDNCGQGNNLDCTPFNNYDLRGSAEHLNIGPTPSSTKGNMFFYNQYDNTSYTYLIWMFGKSGASFSPSPNHVHLDVFTAKNTSSDNVTVSDDNWNNDPDETLQESQSESSGLYSSTYAGRYKYSSKYSDGGVIGPFSGSSFRIMVDLGGKSALSPTITTSTSWDTIASGVSGKDLGLGNLSSFKFWSKDSSSFSLGNVDNFTIGYKTSITCE